MTQEPSTAIEIDDAEWLGQADWVVGGEAAKQARKQGLYAGYVLLLFSGVYGFPVLQAVFRTNDTGWLRDQLASPIGVTGVVVAVSAILGAAYWAGRFRGPVVPPLPWIDLVVTAPVDRARAVRRWWRYAVVGGAFVGGVVGLVVGSGLAFAQVTGVVALVVATVLGVVVGLVGARVWLWAQVRSWPGPDHATTGPSLLWRLPDSLRALHAESLRAHSANTSTLAGSALTGNLRTARLSLTRPITHARAVRLHPGGPFAVLVRRDVLGLRRQRVDLVAGAGFAVMGAAVLTWGMAQPAAPSFALGLAMLPLYLGFGSWTEGLRLQADNIGSPALIGTGPLEEAAAHLIAPTGLAAVVLGVAGAFAPVVWAAALPMLALLAGGHLLAAFRGDPPATIVSPQSRLFWYAMPSVTVVLVGAFLAQAYRTGASGLTAFCTALVAAVAAWGVSRVRRLTYRHRT